MDYDKGFEIKGLEEVEKLEGYTSFTPALQLKMGR